MQGLECRDKAPASNMLLVWGMKEGTSWVKRMNDYMTISEISELVKIKLAISLHNLNRKKAINKQNWGKKY